MSTKISFFIVLIIFITLLTPFTVFADNDEDAIVVKIGYSDNYGIIKTPQFEGYEGYGYEYLHKIAEYTDNNYKLELIECSLEDGIDMLRKNEIQILAPMNFTPERDKEFIFSNQPFARDAMFLTSLNGNNITENNYDTINNSNIAVKVSDNTVNNLQTFLDDNNLKANTTPIVENSYSPDDVIDNYDFFVFDSMQMDINLEIALNLGINDVYLMGNTKSKAIMSDFDVAMERIVQQEYLYKEQLYVKYFNYTINDDEYISDEEYQTLIDNGPYNVGVTSLYTSFGYDQLLDIVGLPYDIIKALADMSGMEVNYNKITETTIEQVKNNLDFYVNPIGYVEDTDKRTSVPFLTTPLIVVQNHNESQPNDKVGVISNFMLEDDVIDYLAPNKNVVTYSGIEELSTAFKRGYVDTILIVETSYSCVYNIIQNLQHSITVTDYVISPVIIYSDSFPQECIDIIDKLITHIDNDYVEIATIKNSTLLSEADKSNFLNSYLRVFIIVALIIIIIYIKTNKNRDLELEKISSIDELTGLLTHRKFVEETRKILDQNPNSNYTLICIDIDNFKYINEIYSYEVGSNILKKISSIIKSTIVEDMPIARVSADNFLILVHTDGLFAKIHKHLKSDNPLLNEINEYVSEHYSINFSIGSYDIIDKSLSVTYMIDCCNLSHSFSKIELGTAYKAFSDDMKQKESNKNNIVASMNQALKDKEFVIFYQPKFDIVTMEITGAEGLVRWFCNGNMVPPNDFIPIFEENGFIENLDYYVVERACEFIKENPDRKLPVLSVNLSGITIMKNDIVDKIMEIVTRHNIKPQQLDLEITESAFVDHFEMAIESIDKFRELGFTISMDDFGAGISSLNRLKEISIDILKIDREFIVGSLENEKGNTIIRNIVLMAKDLDLETVAEGIETDEQLEFLRNLGCNVGQGYFFSRPLPEDDFLKKLDEV